MLDANSFPTMPNLLTNPFSRQYGNQGYAILLPDIPIDLLLSLKILQGFSHHDHQCQNIEEIYHTWMQVLLLQFSSQFLNYSLHTNSSKFNKKPFSSTVSHSLHHYSFKYLEKVNKAVAAHLLSLPWGYTSFRFESAEYFISKRSAEEN